MATAHVADHAIGAANYAAQAVHRAAAVGEEGTAVAEERAWQYRWLVELEETGDRN